MTNLFATALFVLAVLTVFSEAAKKKEKKNEKKCIKIAKQIQSDCQGKFISIYK